MGSDTNNVQPQHNLKLILRPCLPMARPRDLPWPYIMYNYKVWEISILCSRHWYTRWMNFLVELLKRFTGHEHCNILYCSVLHIVGITRKSNQNINLSYSSNNTICIIIYPNIIYRAIFSLYLIMLCPFSLILTINIKFDAKMLKLFKV